MTIEPDGIPIIDRSAAKARILARYRDEAAGPPHGSEVAMRCTDHGAFITWVSPPAPPCRVACPSTCTTAGRPA